MSVSKIAVIDYGMGNLHSVASALHCVAPRAEVVVTNDAQLIASADRVVFPGVGGIRDCVAEIKRLQLHRSVFEAIQSGKPVLAICVGLQVLMDSSEESPGTECLGHFAGEVKAFSGYADFNRGSGPGCANGARQKVPHMGWNQVRHARAHPLWHKIPDEARFYFVHSYCVQAKDKSAVAGTCHYGVEFSAALARDNLFAAQFHPEKSHTSGLQLLANFAAWDGQP